MKNLIALTLFLSASANADYKLAENGKTVNCYADDNQDWVLNKSRTKVKYTIEGESLGAKKIIDTKTDGQTVISYSTNEGILTLGEKDTYQFADENEAHEVECK